MNDSDRSDDHGRLWDVAEPYLGSGRLIEGTMMGHPCLRCAKGNGFVATVERGSGHLVVKLPRERVAALIDAGEGQSFAPAGKVFREWVLLATDDDQRLVELLVESIGFVESH